MKYINSEVTFREIPDEISLCFNITNCPNRCPDCHSKWLWDDTGIELTATILIETIKQNPGITCVCFMGGDANLNELSTLIQVLKYTEPTLKVAWYTGHNDLWSIPSNFPISNIDYVKTGKFVKELGPLNKPTTNQRMWKRDGDILIDITERFWKNTFI